MLDAAQQIAFEAESQQLRQALKIWETTWAREHGGAKPGRDDIKRNAEIAQKYTKYNRVRGILAGTISPSETTAKKDEARRKRKQAPPFRASVTAPDAAGSQHHSMQTPSKRQRRDDAATRVTPSMRDQAENLSTPSISRKLFSPVVPTSIGPTPQRDGRVLGLFDVLSEEDDQQHHITREEDKQRRRSAAVEATPSKRTAAEAAHLAAGIQATPRKQTLDSLYTSDDDEHGGNARRLGRTPMSSGRRNLLNHFTGGAGTTSLAVAVERSHSAALGTTPLKARDANSQRAQQSSLLETPSKGDSGHVFATPAFLRRQPPAVAMLPVVDENGDILMSPPSRLRLPRKPLVRGLSSVLASLRRMEDEQLDEQLDVLRELEGDMDLNDGMATMRPAPRAPAPQLTPVDGVQVEDSQVQPSSAEAVPRLLGGFDDEGLYDSPPEDAPVGRDGQPLRVFKKKGQKRTTRFVNMRPTRTKRPATGATAEESDSEGEGEGDGILAAETQLADQGTADAWDGDILSGSEYGSGAEDEAKAKASRTKAKDKKTDKKTDKKKDKKRDKDKTKKDGGAVKKAVRKVNELAHANFKRLKLRNNGSKGGPGFNSRFRRRR